MGMMASLYWGNTLVVGHNYWVQLLAVGWDQGAEFQSHQYFFRMTNVIFVAFTKYENTREILSYNLNSTIFNANIWATTTIFAIRYTI